MRKNTELSGIGKIHLYQVFLVNPLAIYHSVPTWKQEPSRLTLMYPLALPAWACQGNLGEAYTNSEQGKWGMEDARI